MEGLGLRNRQNAGVGGTAGMYNISPYLNIDPNLLAQQEPEFIIPEGQNAKRGRSETALPTIGSCLCSGAGAGSAYGIYKGLTDENVKSLEGKYLKSPWRTQFINVVTRHSSAAARVGGTLGMFYCGTGAIITQFTDDRWIVSTASGFLTGGLYKCFSGLRQSAISAAVGALVASAVYGVTSTKTVKSAVYQSRSYF